MKRIYLCGPMTALNFYSSFKIESDRLRGLGYEVVNPAEEPVYAGYHESMREELKAMLDCDTLALLDGWQRSASALLEMHVANRVGMDIVIAKEVVK
jgi:hypothetical protein